MKSLSAHITESFSFSKVTAPNYEKWLSDNPAGLDNKNDPKYMNAGRWLSHTLEIVWRTDEIQAAADLYKLAIVSFPEFKQISASDRKHFDTIVGCIMTQETDDSDLAGYMKALPQQAKTYIKDQQGSPVGDDSMFDYGLEWFCMSVLNM